jgi:hypothetical protein
VSRHSGSLVQKGLMLTERPGALVVPPGQT